MTNKEILQGKFLYPLPETAFNSALGYNGLVPDDAYLEQNEKLMDLSLAGLIFTACTAPQSVRELDYQLTNQSVTDLLRLRAALLRKWNVEDETVVKPTIRGRSPW